MSWRMKLLIGGKRRWCHWRSEGEAIEAVQMQCQVKYQFLHPEPVSIYFIQGDVARRLIHYLPLQLNLISILVLCRVSTISLPLSHVMYLRLYRQTWGLLGKESP